MLAIHNLTMTMKVLLLRLTNESELPNNMSKFNKIGNCKRKLQNVS